MHQFIETIKILDGTPHHLEWHQRRMDATLQHFYPAHHHSWNLEKCIDVLPEFSSGLVRCRVTYDAHHLEIQFFHYQPRQVQTLSMVEIPEGAHYAFKYADRRWIDDLFEKRGAADDILMTRNGWITDTSIANIAILKNGRWYTPSIPLLAGTTRKRLVSGRILLPRPIHAHEIETFESCRIFNAMKDFGSGPIISTKNIIRLKD